MDPIRFAIQKPVTVSVGVLLILLFGLISIGIIPVQLTPNVDKTIVTVQTHWEGASPQEVENDVIRRQEEKLKSVSNLRKMTSVSQQSRGTVTLEFYMGTSQDAALREVSDKMREVSGYPDNVDEPVILSSDPMDRDYIAWVMFKTSDPDFDIRQLQDFAEDEIKPELERVDGVSELNVLGGYEREVQVRVDPTRLAQRGITARQLASALQQQNISVSAGQLTEGKLNVRVRTTGRFEDLAQVQNTVLSAPGRPLVRVRDVADVELTFKEPEGLVRAKGQTVLAINAQREAGSNVITVMGDFRERLRELNEEILPKQAQRLGINGNLELDLVYDQTVYINQALNLVTSNLWIGGALAVVVLLIFLRSFTATMIVGLAIPVSVIGTFVALVAMGRNLNVISLAGLAFAVGMVVDNAIVVLENIDRHRRIGENLGTAAYRGASEVWGAILASTLTTLAVFLPVLTVQEEAGQLFRDISLAICAAVTLSFLVAITVIPSASNRMLQKARTDKEQGRLHRMFDNLFGIAPLAGWLVGRFSDLIYRLCGSWFWRLTLVVLMGGGAMLASYLLMPPSSYLPVGNRNLVIGFMFAPPGYSLPQQEKIAHRVESSLRPVWEAEMGTPSAEALPTLQVQTPFAEGLIDAKVPPIDDFFFVAWNEMLLMGATSENDDNVFPLMYLFNQELGQIPGVYPFAFQVPLFQSGAGTGNSIEMEITGSDLDQIVPVAGQLFGMIRQRFGSVRPDPTNFNLPGPEVQVRYDEVRGGDVGLSNTDLALAVQMFGDGAIIGDYLYQGDTIDLKLINRNGESGDAMYLQDQPLATPTGRVVPLRAVADVVRTTAPQEIKRIEEQPGVTLIIDVPENLALEQAMAAIQTEMVQPLRESGVIPPNVAVRLAGTAAKLQTVKEALLGAWHGWTFDSLFSLITSRAFLALLVTFMLMAALFESWLYPFVIMFSVPLATVGGFLGLRIAHTVNPTQQLDVLTMLGFVILVGIVVNNAILLVHQALNLMRGDAEVEFEGHVVEKLPPRRAIAESVRTRVRPIFMSTFTSIGGMLPLVLFPGAGSELYRGLGSVVVGGLLVSAMFTLILVPLVMSLVMDLRRQVVSVPEEARVSKPESETAAEPVV